MLQFQVSPNKFIWKRILIYLRLVQLRDRFFSFTSKTEIKKKKKRIWDVLRSAKHIFWFSTSQNYVLFFSLFLQCRLVMITHSTVYSFCSCTGFEMLICELCSHFIIKLENGSHPNKTLCKERTRAFQIHVKHATQECNLPWNKATKIKHERLHSSHWLCPSSWSSAGGWAQLWPLISAIEAIAHHRYLKSLIR